MAERKTIGKALRFEVFKRDKFCCQYCGKKAPDVVLQCDHISPVSQGGENTLLNLVTACVDCNLGKGARTLDDSSAVAKQRAELERLAERREQIDMMMEWSREMADMKDYEVDALIARAGELFHPFFINESGRAKAKKWLQSFPLDELLAALAQSVTQYMKRSADGTPEQDSIELAWKKIPGVARVSRMPQDLKDLYYVRGILRNRLNYIDDHYCLTYLRDAYDAGITVELLKRHARQVRNWTEWREDILRMVGSGTEE